MLKKTVQKSIEEFTKNAAKHLGREILPKLSRAVFRIALLRCIGFVGSDVAWALLQQNTAVIVRGVVAAEASRFCRTGTKEVVKTVGQSLAVKKIPGGNSPRKTVCRMTKSGVLAGKMYKSACTSLLLARKLVIEVSNVRDAKSNNLIQKIVEKLLVHFLY